MLVFEILLVGRVSHYDVFAMIFDSSLKLAGGTATTIQVRLFDALTCGWNFGATWEPARFLPQSSLHMWSP